MDALRGLNPFTDAWCREFLADPFLEGVGRLQVVTDSELPWSHRVIVPLKGLALMTPIIGAVLWIFWRTFGNPDSMINAAHFKELDKQLRPPSPAPLPAAEASAAPVPPPLPERRRPSQDLVNLVRQIERPRSPLNKEQEIDPTAVHERPNERPGAHSEREDPVVRAILEEMVAKIVKEQPLSLEIPAKKEEEDSDDEFKTPLSSLNPLGDFVVVSTPSSPQIEIEPPKPEIPILKYNDVHWEIKENENGSVIRELSPTDHTEISVAHYSADGQIRSIQRALPLGERVHIELQGKKLIIKKIGGEAKPVTYTLDRPWIQQTTFGFKAFLKSDEKELPYCVVNMKKDHALCRLLSIVNMKIEKTDKAGRCEFFAEIRFTPKSVSKATFTGYLDYDPVSFQVLKIGSLPKDEEPSILELS